MVWLLDSSEALYPINHTRFLCFCCSFITNCECIREFYIPIFLRINVNYMGGVGLCTHTKRHRKAQMVRVFPSVYCTYSQLNKIDPLWTARNFSWFFMLMNEDLVRRKLFHITGHLWGESSGHRWIPLKRPVMWNFFVLAWTSCWG